MKASGARATWAWLAVLLLALGVIVWQAARPTAPVAHDDEGDHSDAAARLITLAEANWSAVELLEEKFNLDYHFKAVDTIFARVFGSD